MNDLTSGGTFTARILRAGEILELTGRVP